MFPFSGGLNGDDPVPDEEFEDLFDYEEDDDDDGIGETDDGELSDVDSDLFDYGDFNN